MCRSSRHRLPHDPTYGWSGRLTCWGGDLKGLTRRLPRRSSIHRDQILADILAIRCRFCGRGITFSSMAAMPLACRYIIFKVGRDLMFTFIFVFLIINLFWKKLLFQQPDLLYKCVSALGASDVYPWPQCQDECRSTTSYINCSCLLWFWPGRRPYILLCPRVHEL